MSRTVRTRKRGEDGARRTVVAAKRGDIAALDDRPLAVVVSRDHKRLIVVMPWELWILDAKDLSRQRSIEVDAPHPCVTEDAEGLLWIGGRHLYRGSSWGSGTTKVGTKLGGFVDRVALLRPDLLCGAGRNGEILWNVAAAQVEHRRKASEHEVHALIATPDERAMWADGTRAAWVVDPAHPQGYTQVHLRRTSPTEVFEEGVVALGVSTRGRCLLGARDGGVAWTAPDLRIAAEHLPRADARAAETLRPLGLVGDERWIYALRPRGLLQRFLIEQPPTKPKSRSPRPPGTRPEPEPEPLPAAQSCRLARPADCLALLPGEGGHTRLVLAGAHGDGHLGRLWIEDPEQLEWHELALGERRLEDQRESTPAPAPPTRSKLHGPPLREIRVDDVLAGNIGHWVTTDHGAFADRPVAPDAPVEPGDALLLPAMIRFREGTARPALVCWPAAAAAHGDPAPPGWLTWGDASTGWIALETPEIRRQRWSRTDLFPLQVALARPMPTFPGRRAALPERWVDPEHFAALARECKKLLKVLW